MTAPITLPRPAFCAILERWARLYVGVGPDALARAHDHVPVYPTGEHTTWLVTVQDGRDTVTLRMPTTGELGAEPVEVVEWRNKLCAECGEILGTGGRVVADRISTDRGVVDASWDDGCESCIEWAERSAA